MKTKVYSMPKERINNANILQWTARYTADIARRGYRVVQVSYSELESLRQYRITIFYSGNILQRAWRKLTQW